MTDKEFLFDQFWDDIKDDVVTIADAHTLIAALNHEQENHFFKNQHQMPTVTVLNVTLNRDHLTAAITALQSLPIIGLTIAYFPPRRHLVEFAHLLRQKIVDHSLLQVAYDPDLVAGAVIKYEGEKYIYGAFERV